jgi:phosphate transport system permease protein
MSTSSSNDSTQTPEAPVEPTPPTRTTGADPATTDVARPGTDAAEGRVVTPLTPGGRGPAPSGGGVPGRMNTMVVAVVAVIAAVLILAAGTDVAATVVIGTIVGGIVVFAWSAAVEGRRAAVDRGVTYAVTAAFVLAMLPLISLLYTVVTLGAPRFDSAFFTESARNVVGAGGGASHAIVGTLIITGLATLISVPVGVMAAIYLQEYGRGPLKRWLTFFVDVMTGIPSIVAGLFAFALFTLFFGPGVRLGIMGAVALSVLMIPIVVRSTEEMLKIVPPHLREASYALGVPKWRTITKVVLPTALAGIVTGVMVSVARVIGETAPLLITAGVFTSTNTNPFDGRMQSLPVFAFNQYKNPGIPRDPFIDRAWTAALTLIVLVMVLNLIARLIYRRFGTEVRS